jgi:hypothetical protein
MGSQSASASVNRLTGQLVNELSRWKHVEYFTRRPLLASALAALTDNSGGTAATTIAQIAAVDGSGSNAAGVTTTRAAVAQLALSVNGLLLANELFGITGTNAANAGVTFAAGGGVTLTTTTTAADQVIIGANTISGQSGVNTAVLNTSAEPAFGTVITTGATFVSTIIWAGMKLTDTSVIATDADQAFFRVNTDGDSAKFVCVASIGGVDYEYASDIVVEAASTYQLEIDINSDRKASFYITVNNGQSNLVWTSEALTASTSLKPFIGVQTSAAAAAVVTVRNLALGRNF